MKENRRRKLISPQELAEYLGISLGTVYSYTYQKLIPYIKIGRLARFDPAEVETWVRQRRIEPYRGE